MYIVECAEKKLYDHYIVNGHCDDEFLAHDILLLLYLHLLRMWLPVLTVTLDSNQLNVLWVGMQVAVFLSLLGLTVLPISAVVGNYISNIYEDRYILTSSILMDKNTMAPVFLVYHN